MRLRILKGKGAMTEKQFKRRKVRENIKKNSRKQNRTR
jgi:hypothetical protein